LAAASVTLTKERYLAKSVFMRLFRLFFGLLIALLLSVHILPGVAYAASSAAIRAIDDNETITKDFSGQSLVKAEFADANFKDANFSGADLRGVVFNGTSLIDADLTNVDFSDGIAYLTDFSGANLSNAVFTSAMLLKSSFKNARVTGADFSDAAIDRGQVLQLCQTASGTNPVTGVETRESLGCR
jgi:hypothetical protein